MWSNLRVVLQQRNTIQLSKVIKNNAPSPSLNVRATNSCEHACASLPWWAEL